MHEIKLRFIGTQSLQDFSIQVPVTELCRFLNCVDPEQDISDASLCKPT